MISRLIPIFCGFLCISTFADPNFQGYIPVSQSRDLFVTYQKANRGEPTVVFLNGLTYETRSWGRFATLLCPQGRGCLRYDMEGQGKTLSHQNQLLSAIPVELQVHDLKVLLTALKIETPVVLVGLSYGGGVGIVYASTFPRDVSKLVLLSPFTRPVKSQDDWILSQVRWTRLWQPWNTASDDELYDFYLRQLVYGQYPIFEPVLLSHPLRLEAAFQMTRGIRKFQVSNYLDSLPENVVHLVEPLDDEYIDRDAYSAFWNALPGLTRASRLQVISGKHKLPEQVPKFLSAWLEIAIGNNRWLSDGREFLGNFFLGTARANDIELKIHQEPQP